MGIWPVSFLSLSQAQEIGTQSAMYKSGAGYPMGKKLLVQAIKYSQGKDLRWPCPYTSSFMFYLLASHQCPWHWPFSKGCPSPFPMHSRSVGLYGEGAGSQSPPGSCVHTSVSRANLSWPASPGQDPIMWGASLHCWVHRKKGAPKPHLQTVPGN